MNETTIANKIGARLRYIRVKNNLGNIDELSRLLGVNKNTLGIYERGERLPDIEFLADFSEITNTDFFNLLYARLASSKSINTSSKSEKLIELLELKKKHTEKQENRIDNKDILKQTILNATQGDYSEKQATALHNAFIAFLNSYQAESNNDRDLVVTLLLTELQYTNKITEEGATKIIETLKSLREVEEKKN